MAGGVTMGCDASECPFISVVIPTYNRRYHLDRTLRSLIGQDYPKDRYEIIVVDNSSTDGTADLVESLRQEAACPLRYFLKEPEGPGPARNLGVENARGELIAFIDSDCVADPRWLREGARLVCGDVGLVQGKTLPDPGAPFGALSRSVTILKLNHTYEGCNMFFRREAIVAVGGISGGYSTDRVGKRETYVIGGEDTDLAYRVIRSGWRSEFAPQAVVYHEVTRQSLWQWLVEPRYARWPMMVRRFPELRKQFFLRCFISPHRFYFLLAVLALILGLAVSPWFLLLGPAYVVHCALLPSVSWKGPMKLFRAPVCFPRDAVTLALLLVGSVRYRRLVL
jgi:glycosyltransferase involved in cell wall biosynthesis